MWLILNRNKLFWSLIILYYRQSLWHASYQRKTGILLESHRGPMGSFYLNIVGFRDIFLFGVISGLFLKMLYWTHFCIYLLSLRLLASANSTTIVELIVELIGELFVVELLNYNFSNSQKACFNWIRCQKHF